MKPPILLLIIVLFKWISSAQLAYYVKPNVPSSCHGQPCLTLDQYTQQKATYFTTGSTFLFLPGNHTLQTTIILTNISDLVLRGIEDQGSDITIIHGNGGNIICMNVVNLTIDGLNLRAIYLDIASSNDILISNSIFLRNDRFNRALTCNYCNITVTNCQFAQNSHIEIEHTRLDIIDCTFTNSNSYEGGAIRAVNSFMSVKGIKRGVTFSGNFADDDGGAMFVCNTDVVFSGTVILFENNISGGDGGGILSSNSSLTFTSSTTLFYMNIAKGEHLIYDIYYRGGGAICAYNSGSIKFNNTITFSYNSATAGGAMKLIDVILTFLPNMNLTTSYNNALEFGGAIHYRDTKSTAINQCIEYYGDELRPNCFIQFSDIKNVTSIAMYSYNNSAGREGSFLYGGLLDKCQLKSTSSSGVVEYYTGPNVYNLLLSNVFTQPNNNYINNIVSSQPYILDYCEGIQIPSDIIIHRGQQFTVPLVAIAQGGTTSTSVTVRLSNTARLKLLNQTSQKLQRNCSVVSYNLYSTEDTEILTLHAEGLCSEITNFYLHVTFLPCPAGFIQSSEQCICERRLRQYTNSCTTDEDVSITRYYGSTFWINASYVNATYQGLILYKTCPVEYCKTETIAISLGNPDMQCAMNRSGVLCGECITNHSLMFGSSRCNFCPNTYLALLLPFAAAGIALVLLSFLSLIKTTVVTGMINSVILYANIMQVNRRLFFPTNIVNVLTVFIAWMNLDLGIETCFYDGMTAYAKTWLQFAFPIYIWTLIALIIITSRYSVRVSRLIGHNPIAALNTLVLMSYTKILKIIIDVYSSAQLEYPDNKIVTVWLKDGHVPYLQSWHLLLTIVTSLVVVFIFFPYTLLLLLGYKLYRFSGRKHMHWLNRLKPLLDSYYGPYKTHTRYWTGFLLLVRCALYIVFTLENATISLFAIIITFFIIVLAFALIPGRIYTNSYTNIIESLAYSNLIVLSGVVLSLGPYNIISTALVYSLVGMVLVITISIIVYPFYMHSTFVSLRLKIRTKISAFFHRRKIVLKNKETATENTPKEVSTSVIELREPLLEN